MQSVKNAAVIFGNGVGAGCLMYCFSEHVFGFHWLCGTSMTPTLQPRSIVGVRKWKKPLEYQPCDVVLLRSPVTPNELAIKRITALEGDTIRTNGKQIVIPQGRCWLEGDNRVTSRDSREYGPAPIALLEGKAIFAFRLWPPKFTLLTRHKDDKNNKGEQ